MRPGIASLLVSCAGSGAETESPSVFFLSAAQKGSLDFPAMVHGPIENFLVSHLWKTADHAEPVHRY